jgi:hypothetical protein
MSDVMERDLVGVRAEAEPILARIETVTIASPAARQQAATDWDTIRSLRKLAEQIKEVECRPLKDLWETAKAPFDTFKKLCEAAETMLQAKMSAWDREQDRLARIEQEKLAKKIAEQNAKAMEKAEAKGLEPVLKATPIVEGPAKSVETGQGTVQTRSTKTVYTIKGLEPGEELKDLKGDDPRVAELLASWPSLFDLNPTRFKKAAEAGLLAKAACVEARQEYTYSQRSA